MKISLKKTPSHYIFKLLAMWLFLMSTLANAQVATSGGFERHEVEMCLNDKFINDPSISKQELFNCETILDIFAYEIQQKIKKIKELKTKK